MDLNLPYTHRERMGSGRLRFRVERGINGKRRRLPIVGEPGSREWMADRELKLRMLEDKGLEAAVARYPQGSVGWLVGEFLTATEKRVNAGLLSLATLRRYRLQLGRLVEAKSSKGKIIGNLPAAMPRNELIRIRDNLLGTPAAADSFLKTVSKLYNWSLKSEVLAVPNPAEKVDRVDTKSDGYAIANRDDVKRFLERHPPGTLPRLALIMVLCTAARRGDLVRLGPAHVREYEGTTWLAWRQEKPPHIEVEIPMLDMLAEELARHAKEGERWPATSTWLARFDGEPRSKKAFGALFGKWAAQAGTDKSLHGYRKGVASILPEFGVSEYHIDVLLGHEQGSGTSKIYTRGAERRKITVELNRAWNRVDWGVET